MSNKPARIIIAITGASGAVYGIRLLEMLKQFPVERHLVISKSAGLTITQETDYTLEQVQALADVVHPYGNVGACIASGSYHTLGMIVAPCSMKSLSEIATCTGGNLIGRAADVILKEKRKLVLMVRETPLHSIHLRHMAALSDMGVFICPPVPAFYAKPQSLEEMVRYTVGRVLDIFDLDVGLKRWEGLKNT